MNSRKLIREARKSISKIADANGLFKATIGGKDASAEEVKKAMRKAIGEGVRIEVEELCWCGCGLVLGKLDEFKT